MIQAECPKCKRFGAPVNDRCRYCGTHLHRSRKFEWVVIISIIVMLVALFRVLLFGGG